MAPHERSKKNLLDGDLGAGGLEACLGLLGGLLVGLLEDAFGAASTRSLASFRPRLVSSRTTLMTWIFWLAGALEDDVELVLLRGSLGVSACAGRAATATAAGAAAVTSKVSSNCFTNSLQLDQRHLLERVKKLISAQLRHSGVLLCSGRAHESPWRPRSPSVPRAGLAARRRSASPPARPPQLPAARRCADGLDSGAGTGRQPCASYAFIAPASLASSTSRDSRSASLATSASEIRTRPSNTPPLMTSSVMVLREIAKALGGLNRVAGDEGDGGRSGEQTRRPPVYVGARRSALRGEGVLDDRVRRGRSEARRSWSSWATVRPRYSVSTVAGESRKLSVELGNGSALVGPNFVRHVPPSLLVAGLARNKTNAPGARAHGADTRPRIAADQHRRSYHSCAGHPLDAEKPSTSPLAQSGDRRSSGGTSLNTLRDPSRKRSKSTRFRSQTLQRYAQHRAPTSVRVNAHPCAGTMYAGRRTRGPPVIQCINQCTRGRHSGSSAQDRALDHEDW